MAVFKCKMCGGTVEFEPGATVGVCDSCGTKQTLPRLDDDRRANLYDRANHFRRNNDFDKAAGLYEQILNEDSSDAEAYWSLVLCRYGIEYVEDPATHRRVPTVNRAQFTSVFDDDNYKSAIRYADIAQRQLYEDEARTINEIQKGILSISQKEEPFDVFICYKETDANGRRTPDSVLANDLYHQLTQEGFKVFFARITLEDKLGTAYEPYIFAALNSAKVMVVLGTKPEYFNAVWVKNEWSRYLALVKNSGGRKVLIPAYKDMDPYDLPEEFSHLQAQDMSKLGFMQDLIRGIKKIAQTDEPKQTVIKETVVTSGTVNTNTAPLLKRAFMFLEDGEWSSANEYCEKVLDIDPECAQAYLGKLMAELRVKAKNDLADCSEPFDDRNNYKKTLRFCDDALRETLTGYITHIKERNELTRLTGIYTRALAKMNTADTEEDYKSAAEQFFTIRGFKDADTLADKCMEKAEFARNNRIYSSAIREMEFGINDCYNEDSMIECYNNAIAQFQAIQGWKDADERISICRNRIEEINAKVKADRLQAEREAEERRIRTEREAEERRIRTEREAEERRIATEKAAKKRKKIIAIVTPILCVCIVFAIILTQVIIPRQKYNKAISLIDAGDYDAAYEILEEIGNNEAIAVNKYDRAMGLIDAGEYDSAYELLEEIGDNETIAASKYDWAMERIDAQDYETAYMFLDGLNYKDSKEKQENIKPQYFREILMKAKVGDIFFFGSYEQDNDAANGKENIEWIILAKEGSSILVVSDKALDCQSYNKTYADVTWENCTLRRWLNAYFLNSAFSDVEKTLISSVKVSDDDETKNDSTDSDKVKTDNVFLLSIAEVNEYFDSDEARKCVPTDYAIANGVDTSNKDGTISCKWLVRSPGGLQSSVPYDKFFSDEHLVRCRMVGCDGVVRIGMDYVGSDFRIGDNLRFEDMDAVRPAMWINLDAE